MLPCVVAAFAFVGFDATAKPRKKGEAAPKKVSKVPAIPTSTSAEVRAWAQGVSDADQLAATRLFEEGNKQFANKAYDEARKLYQKALGHWKHPAAQFNLAECLILLDQPVQAYKQLKASMRFGVQPLGAEMLQRAVVRKQLLEGQLATVQIKNPVDGAKVTLNGEVLFSGVNEVTRLVRPGHFQVVATKPGYVTQTTAITVFPAKAESITVSLRRPSGKDVEFSRRWAAWKPWAVVGGGALLGSIGGYLYTRSVSTMDEYDREIGLQCGNGCDSATLSASTRNLEDQAKLLNTVSIATMGTAGVLLATGAVLVYMNQLHPQTESAVRVVAVPTVDGGAQATLSYDF